MSEWSKEHDWKSCDVKASAGSNPVLCAMVAFGFLLIAIFLILEF